MTKSDVAISRMQGGIGACAGKSLGRLIDRGKDFQDSVEFCEFEAVVDHGLRSSYAQRAAGGSQSGEAPDKRTHRGAVGVGYTSHIEDYANLAGRDQIIHGVFQSCALRAAMNAAFHGQYGDAGLHDAFLEFENHDTPSAQSS